MVADIQQAYRSRELILAWAYRTVRARYKQSVLGSMWAIIQPLATVAIFTVIFTFFVPVDTGDIPYPVFSYTAMVPWLLFSSSIMDMADSLVGNINLVTKIYFPREVLPFAALLARLVDFVIASLILLLSIVLFRVPIFLEGWLLLPAILLIQLALAVGIGLVGAALNVFYRDVKHVYALGLQVWLYASPIIYPVETVPPAFRSLYMLNPMAGLIEAYRAILLRQQLPGPFILLSALEAILILIFGYWFFKRLEPQFADVA